MGIRRDDGSRRVGAQHGSCHVGAAEGNFARLGLQGSYRAVRMLYSAYVPKAGQKVRRSSTVGTVKDVLNCA